MMKREFTPPSRGLLTAYRIFMALIILLIVLFSIGSFYALVRGPDSKPLFRLGGGSGGGVSGGGPAISGGGQGGSGGGAAVSVFNGIGRLRIPVAAYPSGGGGSGSGTAAATMILSIAFPYPAQDQPFTEELASHIGDFRFIAADYFSSLPAEKIANMDEEAAKAEVLRRYNAILRLGKITALYFNDLMIIE